MSGPECCDGCRAADAEDRADTAEAALARVWRTLEHSQTDVASELEAQIRSALTGDPNV